jgi:DNA polymerase II
MPCAPLPAQQTPPLSGYVLHVFHRQERGRVALYAVGRLQNGQTFGLVDTRLQPLFYIRRSDTAVTTAAGTAHRARISACGLTTMDGEPVLRVECRRLGDIRDLAAELATQGVRTYEADLNFDHQYRTERGLRGSIQLSGPWRPGRDVDRIYVDPPLERDSWVPKLAVLVLDIETDMESGQVLAVSLVGDGPLEQHRTEEIHLVGDPLPDDRPSFHCHGDEPSLLRGLMEAVRRVDPDVLTGWNVIDFDLLVLQQRCRTHGIPFNLGRTSDDSWYREGQGWGRSRMTVYGRQIVDAMHLIRASLQRFDDLRLNTVAHAVLGRGKSLTAGDNETMPDVIMRAFTQDRAAFCEYCLEDSRLVRDILEREGLMDLTLRRSLLTGLPLERAWGSIAAFDLLYVGELHRRGMVAPSIGVDRLLRGGSPGGLVLEPQAGLFRHIFVFDFRSLYPSLMRTFNLDPLAHVWGQQEPEKALQAPNGAVFSRRPGILPDLLAEFFDSRAQAKEREDPVASQAYKILMNSFYGVLATDACRFAADALAGAITGFGHHVLNWTRDLLQQEAGHRVIYGDTDSVFVDPGLEADITPAAAWQQGEEMCAWINQRLRAYIRAEYDVESLLEMEFEKHYARFLLPPMRGSERGRAKGYAGLRLDREGAREMEIVGMEAVRRDWTRLAHQLQRELLALVFDDAPAAHIETCVAACMQELRAGKRDADLVYHKALRKPVEAYTSASPPHVKAARLLERPGGIIHYVMTQNGPQPTSRRTAPIDYEHYVQKQIAPLVHTLAQVTPLDVNAVLKGETDLFGPAGGGASRPP